MRVARRRAPAIVTSLCALQVRQFTIACTSARLFHPDKFVYSALGDLRNVMATVNNLPSDYTGTCTIVLNSLNTYVASRTLITLYLLLGATPVDEAAEGALHLGYSASLTPEMAGYLAATTHRLLDSFDVKTTLVAERGGSSLEVIYPPVIWEEIREQLSSAYDHKTAATRRCRVMLAKERLDYRERHIMALKPPHRLSFVRHRSTNILLPYCVSDERFTELNRYLLSPRLLFG
jgi:hypothetical protein